MIDNIVAQLKEHEGFRGQPYDDHLGNPTIGYGTLLPLSKAESVMLLRHRLISKAEELFERSEIYRQASEEVRFVVLNMAYQLGVNGVLKFRLMWRALEQHDYRKASVEMLDSRWATQTPNRAFALAKIMSEIKG